MKRSWIWPAAACVWSAALLVGFGLLAFHQFQSGARDASAPPRTWPGATPIDRDPTGATLVMVAHPYCPCMVATLSELATVMRRLGPRVRAYVLFLQVPSLGPTWSHSRTWDQAAGIPGVTVLEDLDGSEAKRFHLAVSGETALYDAAGALRFHGGITPSRGHSGDNLGRQRIISLVENGTADRDDHQVFGCSVGSPSTVGQTVTVPAALAPVPLVGAATRGLCSACHTVESRDDAPQAGGVAISDGA